MIQNFLLIRNHIVFTQTVWHKEKWLSHALRAFIDTATMMHWSSIPDQLFLMEKLMSFFFISEPIMHAGFVSSYTMNMLYSANLSTLKQDLELNEQQWCAYKTKLTGQQQLVLAKSIFIINVQRIKARNAHHAKIVLLKVDPNTLSGSAVAFCTPAQLNLSYEPQTSCATLATSSNLWR